VGKRKRIEWVERMKVIIFCIDNFLLIGLAILLLLLFLDWKGK